MSNNDKTKQKLMESMRMTKSGSDKKAEEADTNKDTTLQDDKPIKKEKKNTATKKAAKGTEKLSVDPYQSVERVWPD
jgi:hypothetical protein